MGNECKAQVKLHSLTENGQTGTQSVIFSCAGMGAAQRAKAMRTTLCRAMSFVGQAGCTRGECRHNWPAIHHATREPVEKCRFHMPKSGLYPFQRLSWRIAVRWWASFKPTGSQTSARPCAVFLRRRGRNAVPGHLDTRGGVAADKPAPVRPHAPTTHAGQRCLIRKPLVACRFHRQVWYHGGRAGRIEGRGNSKTGRPVIAPHAAGARSLSNGWLGSRARGANAPHAARWHRQ